MSRALISKPDPELDSRSPELLKRVSGGTTLLGPAESILAAMAAGAPSLIYPARPCVFEGQGEGRE